MVLFEKRDLKNYKRIFVLLKSHERQYQSDLFLYKKQSNRVQGFIFVQITLENFTLNVSFCKQRNGIKNDCQFSAPACLCIFMQPRFK